VARDVLEAMREPTEGMVTAGDETEVMHSWGSSDSGGSGEFINGSDEIWRAMIDKALAVQPAETAGR
jgi:hypothetical protein